MSNGITINLPFKFLTTKNFKEPIFYFKNLIIGKYRLTIGIYEAEKYFHDIKNILLMNSQLTDPFYLINTTESICISVRKRNFLLTLEHKKFPSKLTRNINTFNSLYY